MGHRKRLLWTKTAQGFGESAQGYKAFEAGTPLFKCVRALIKDRSEDENEHIEVLSQPTYSTNILSVYYRLNSDLARLGLSIILQVFVGRRDVKRNPGYTVALGN